MKATEIKSEPIEFRIQKLRPKKNPKSYHIETLQDIHDAVTPKNIKKFLHEFEMVLRAGILFKAIVKKEGKSTAEIKMPSFEWIDD